jgi:hypothetical protein
VVAKGTKDSKEEADFLVTTVIKKKFPADFADWRRSKIIYPRKSARSAGKTKVFLSVISVVLCVTLCKFLDTFCYTEVHREEASVCNLKTIVS